MPTNPIVPTDLELEAGFVHVKLFVYGRKSLAERCLLRGANGRCSTVDDVDLGVDLLRRMLRELVGWQPKTLAIDLPV